MSAIDQIPSIVFRISAGAQRWRLSPELSAEVVATIDRLHADTGEHVTLSSLLGMIAKRSAVPVLIETAAGRIGAIGLASLECDDGTLVAALHLDIRGPVDAAVAEQVAQRLEETVALCVGPGRPGLVRIASAGSFPCPLGYGFEDLGDGLRTMTRSLATNAEMN